MLPKISKQSYNDSCFYTETQQFPWENLSCYTSSTYTTKKELLYELSNKYKSYLCSLKETKEESESEENEEDTKMQQIHDYLEQLPNRVQQIITLKILHPEYNTSTLAIKLKCHRDSVYESYKQIRKDYPSLVFFTCYYNK